MNLKKILLYITIYIYISIYIKIYIYIIYIYIWDFPGSSASKESACNVEDLDLIPGLGRSPARGHGNPLQYSYLEKPHGQSNLVDYSPCFKQLNTIQWLNNRQQRWSVFARTSYYGKPRNFSPNAVVIKLNIVLKYYRNKHSTFRNMAWFSKKLQAKIQQLLLTRSN